MSIAPLPAAAVRLIGATQVITDACSLIKELIDNALDARATSINIEISLDTLSTIQARDNGHGVAPTDRDLLCRRYCTSKIRGYGDLKDLGGSSLGFRGEALASACEIAGEVGVITRVEGEDVACALKMTQTGEVKSRSRASHPVGTTVKVTDLFKHLPVRKQTAVKSAAKTLARVKTMLQAYALARPNVRFALKVLKAKNDKGNWTYVPAKGQPKEDAAFKVVGKECAGQCEWQVMELHGFEVQAFMPRPDAVASKISNVGHFFSLDDRPVCTVRGTLKQVMTIFKEKLRGCSKSLEGAKDPFIWLNLVCPPGSYDPNVEPAKDDVVFEDSNLVLEAVGMLLSSYYVPAPGDEEPEQGPSTSSGLQEFDEDIEEPLRKRRRSVEPAQRNMYSGKDDNVIMLDDNAIPATSIEEEENSQTGLDDISISNPWTAAKMTSSTKTKLKRTGSARNGQLLTPLHERTEVEDNSASEIQRAPIPAHPPWQLMTPAASSPPKNFGHAREREESPLPFQAVPRRQKDQDDEETVQGMTEDTDRSQVGDLFLPDEPSAQRWRGWSKTADFTSAAHLPPGTPQPPMQNAFEAMLPTPNTNGRPFPPRKRRQKQRQHLAEDDYDDSSAPQAEDETRVWFDHLQDAASGSSPAASGRRQKTQKQRARDDIDIRDMFGGGGSRVPESTISEENSDARKRAGVDMRAFTRKSRGGSVNAPFRPVVPQWRSNQAARETRDDSIPDDHDESFYDAEEQHNNADLPEEDEAQDSSPAFLNQQSQATSAESTNMPDSSLAQLSTPRRLAACLDCHDSDSAPHNHSHNHAHDPPVRPSTTTTTTNPSKTGLKRTRSLAHLPLERTPAAYHIQNLDTVLHYHTPDTLAALSRVRKDRLKSGELLDLEAGMCVWGVLEPLRVGDVVVDEGDGEGIDTRQLQCAFTSPGVEANEEEAWTEWLGTWIARSYSMPDGDFTGNAATDADEGEQLGLYVSDALTGHALLYGQ